LAIVGAFFQEFSVGGQIFVHRTPSPKRGHAIFQKIVFSTAHQFPYHTWCGPVLRRILRFSKKPILENPSRFADLDIFDAQKNVHLQKSESTFVLCFYQQLILNNHLKNQY
jgi:hypothetical protein